MTSIIQNHTSTEITLTQCLSEIIKNCPDEDENVKFKKIKEPKSSFCRLAGDTMIHLCTHLNECIRGSKC